MSDLPSLFNHPLVHPKLKSTALPPPVGLSTRRSQISLTRRDHLPNVSCKLYHSQRLNILCKPNHAYCAQEPTRARTRMPQLHNKLVVRANTDLPSRSHSHQRNSISPKSGTAKQTLLSSTTNVFQQYSSLLAPTDGRESTTVGKQHPAMHSHLSLQDTARQPQHLRKRSHDHKDRCQSRSSSTRGLRGVIVIIRSLLSTRTALTITGSPCCSPWIPLHEVPAVLLRTTVALCSRFAWSIAEICRAALVRRFTSCSAFFGVGVDDSFSVRYAGYVKR